MPVLVFFCSFAVSLQKQTLQCWLEAFVSHFEEVIICLFVYQTEFQRLVGD